MRLLIEHKAEVNAADKVRQRTFPPRLAHSHRADGGSQTQPTTQPITFRRGHARDGHNMQLFRFCGGGCSVPSVRTGKAMPRFLFFPRTGQNIALFAILANDINAIINFEETGR